MFENIRPLVPRARRGRVTILLIGVLAALAAGGGAAHSARPANAAAAPAAACTTSWTTVPSSTFPKDLRDLDVVAANDVWAVGAHTSGQVQTATEHWDGSSWTLVPSPSPGGGENALNGVSEISTNDVWAVGYYQVAKKTSESAFRTLTEHWNGSTWSTVPSPNIGTASNTLSAVDTVSSNDVWAVGYHYVAGEAQRRTLLEHWDGSAWSVVTSPDPGTRSDALLSISAFSADDIWAAGYQSDGMGYSPLLLHYDGTSWSPVSVPVSTTQDTVLTSVNATAHNDAWVGGSQVEGSQTQPFTAHWSGTSWSVVPAPAPGSSYSVLREVSGSASNAWAVGVAYDGAINTFLGFTAHWDGSNWGIVRSVLGGSAIKSEMFAVEKVPGSGQWWAAGRPSDIETICGTPVTSPTFTPHPQPWTASTDPTIPVPQPPIPPTGGGWTLGTAQNVVAQDMAGPAGVYEQTLTHGSFPADFNKDGKMDLFVGRHNHGNISRLYQNNGNGTFTEIDHGTFLKHDRHSCDWADVNQDGLLDLFCMAGSDRGTEAKHNELWIHGAGNTFTDQAGQYGVVDPFGRGRISHFVNANNDQWPDLLVSNFPDRADGLPSPNRLYINVGGTHFVDSPSYGLDLETGAGSISPGDYDRDGRQDLLMDTADGEKVYLNVNGTGYQDVSSALHLAHHPQDVAFADMDGDGKLDVVEVNSTSLKIYLQAGGQFPLSFSTPLAGGYAVATGDVNGDHAPDVFVVQGKIGALANGPDYVYLNNGTGTGFTQMAVPSTTIGQADSASAIDYDGNGLMDFFVENGNGKADNGPLQLIAFFPAP